MTKTKLLLILILLLAFFLRVYKLGDIPISLYMDEASVGYDAFLLSTSGKDQWGQSWPLTFKSFGEYKYPWQIYAALVSGVVWGWSEFSIRFPSAIFGTVNVLLLYFITKLISGKKSVGLFAALLLAVSPWHIQFTRMAWESAYVLLFLYIGIYLFVRGIKEIGPWLPIGTFFMGLSMFAYNSAKLVVPFLFAWTILTYWKDFLQKQRWLIVAGFVLLLFFSINFLGNSFSGLERFNQVGIAENVVRETWLFRLTQNYWVGLIQVWVYQYVLHFSPHYLFISGDPNPRHSIQIVGQLLYIEAFFVLIGLYRFWKLRERWLFWVIGWILISPIPAVITTGAPHALRSILGLGGWQILAAAGFVYLMQLQFVKKSRFLIALIITLIVLNIIFYIYGYFILYPQRYSNDWQYGYSQIFSNPGSFDGFDHIIVSDKGAHPYIFMAWKYKLNYEDFHKNLEYNSEGKQVTSMVAKIRNVYFGPVNFYDFPKGRSLIFAHPSERLTEIDQKGVILNKDGTIAFYVYEYEND